MKICCYWTSCHVSSIWLPLFGNIRFKKWTQYYFVCWISGYLIHGDPMVCLFSVFASLKYIFFSILFSFCRPPKDRTKLALNLDSWKTIYLKVTALFLSLFLMYNFHLSLAAQYCFVSSENIFWFLLFELILGVFFAFIFCCFLKCYPL